MRRPARSVQTLCGLTMIQTPIVSTSPNFPPMEAQMNASLHPIQLHCRVLWGNHRGRVVGFESRGGIPVALVDLLPYVGRRNPKRVAVAVAALRRERVNFTPFCLG
jgi:hypothetical protein